MNSNVDGSGVLHLAGCDRLNLTILHQQASKFTERAEPIRTGAHAHQISANTLDF